MSVKKNQDVWICDLCSKQAYRPTGGLGNMMAKTPQGWALLTRQSTEWAFCSLDCLSAWTAAQ